MNQLALVLHSTEYNFTSNGVGGIANSDNPLLTLVNVISITLGIMTVVAVLWFIFLVLTSALQIVTSGADKASFEKSKKRMTNGLIGLVITLSALFLIDLIANILDIQSVLDLSTFLANLF